MNKKTSLTEILEQECIYTVFQPIVSLENGSIFGYEALSRISLEDCDLNIERLFELAHKMDMLWDLEKLCRTKALNNLAAKPDCAMIFLNVDANIIYDQDFQSGFTAEKLSEYNIPTENVVFEITEKTAVTDAKLFTSSVNHYKNQNFKIAIDDFGSEHSGLNRVCAISPEFLKIDMQLVRGIDTDSVRKSAVIATVDFCRQAGISVIAEGIETEAELNTLIKIGVTYGQGYYLARPNREFVELTPEQKLQIKGCYNRSKLHYTPMFFGKVADLGVAKPVRKLTDYSFDIIETMKKDSGISEFFVTDENNKICGIITRRNIFEKFSGQFGYNLSKRIRAADILQTDFLIVDESMSVDKVAELAMKRAPDFVYDAVAVTKNGEYLCSVTVKDLLLSSIQVQLKQAADASPLTGLPGNNQIQQMIGNTFIKTSPWAIIYLDLDNFKAYNDAYGFSNGDLMLKAVAQSLETCCTDGEFLGHIGGDDFVVIAGYHQVNELCRKIIETFSKSVEALYSPDDWKQGYIVSKNRNGFAENFSIVSLSIAVVTNRNIQPQTTEELSKIIAGTKKIAKQQEGNAIIIA